MAGRLPAEVRPFLVPDSAIALRTPSHRMVREILRLLPGPMLLADSLAELGGEPIVSAEELADLADLDMILDVGPTQYGGPSTVIEVEGERGPSPEPA